MYSDRSCDNCRHGKHMDPVFKEETEELVCNNNKSMFYDMNCDRVKICGRWEAKDDLDK